MATLHLFTGDHPAETIRPALRIREDGFLVQHDVISVGPVRDFASREEWMAERIGFWAGLADGVAFESFPNDFVDQAARLRDAERVVLWVGAGLSDRLLLPALMKLASLERIDLPRIEVAEITRHPSLSVPVLGWGMLRSADVGSPPTRVVDLAERDAARAAWAAFTATDPESLVEFLGAAEDTALVNAMSTLIERYPDSVRGLDHWDASLLAALPDAGSTAFTVIGGAIGASHHHLDPVGDMYLFWRLRRMMFAAREPLVRLDGDVSSMRDCRVMPTELGRAVRDRRASHAAINGIDDWIGGVHLHAKTGSPWYRRNGELIPGSA